MDNWIKNLAIKALHICRINKIAVGNHRQDMSLPVLENLRDRGYSVVTWDSGRSTHSECRDLNKQQFPLDSYIDTTEYSAGIFSRSHPGDQNCTLIVSGSNLPDVRVDSYGQIDEMIGTGRPIKTPKEIQPKIKRLAPKPETRIIEQPIPPKQKTVYVPKDVRKQIKDPFEKQKLSPQEYEDWLRDLEKENVEEERPVQPTDEDREEWLKDLERETSLRIPNWIRGILK